MTIATLSEVLEPAKKNNYAVAGLVVLGWEDARCYAEVADELGLPVILQAGPGCRKNTPIPILGKMFGYLAEQSSSPVVCHIDHGYSLEECQMGIDNGFTSIMYDGSKLELNENIEKTANIVELGHKAGISVEGEIGVVGYNHGKDSLKTNPDEAKKFADAMHEMVPGKILAYNCSPSFNWKKHLSDAEISTFQQKISEMGYKFQFITLAGFHTQNIAIFELAEKYKTEGMTAYSKIQELEFAREKDGYTSVKHQREVGTSYFDAVSNTISSGKSSTTAMAGSTESEQF